MCTCSTLGLSLRLLTTANYKFGTVFFRVFYFIFRFLSVFPFWPILTGLTINRFWFNGSRWL